MDNCRAHAIIPTGIHIISLVANGSLVVTTLFNFFRSTMLRYLITLLASFNIAQSLISLIVTIPQLSTCLWVYNDFFCPFASFIVTWVSNMQIGFLMVIVFEAIFTDVFEREKISKIRLAVLGVFTAAVSVVTPSVFAAYSEVRYDRCNLTLERYVMSFWAWVDTFVFRIFAFFFMVAVYACLLVVTKRKITAASNDQRLRKRYNDIQMLMLISIFTIIFLIPLNFVQLFHDPVIFDIYFAAKAVFSSDVLVLPFFYFLFDDTFKQQLTSIICRCRSTYGEPHLLEANSTNEDDDGNQRGIAHV